MKFNGYKFEYMRYGVGDRVYHGPDGEPILRKGELRDLGVLMSDTARFDAHIKAVASRGRQQAGWVLRSFVTREVQPMMTLYKSTVLPLMEYCCQLWCPRTVGLIRDLEAVQRTYTSRITSLQNMNYWERLSALNLYSLERRRERYIILYTWKIVRGMVPNIGSGGAGGITVAVNLRLGRLCKVPGVSRRAPVSIQSMIESLFAVIGPRLFNCLPKDLRNSDQSLPTFKSKLDDFLRSIPDKPSLPHYHQAAAGNGLLQQLAQMRAEGRFIAQI